MEKNFFVSVSAATVGLLSFQLGFALDVKNGLEVWNLDQVVKRALEISPSLKASRKQVQAAEADARQAGKWDNPEVSLNSGSYQISVLNGTSFQAVLTQAIPLFGQKSAAKDSGLKLAEVAKSDEAIEALELRHEVVERAYQYAAATEQMKHIAHRKEKIALVAKFLATRPFASPAQAVEKNLIQNRIREIEEQFQKIASTRAKRWESLDEMLWLARPIELNLPWVERPTLPQQERHLIKVSTSNPATKRQERVIEAAELSIHQAGKKKFPDLRVGAGYYSQNVDVKETNLFGVLEFSVPLWDWGGNAIEAAENRRDAESLKLEQKKHEVMAEFNRTWADLVEAKSRIEIFPLTLTPKLEAEMTKAETNWRKGLVPATAFLELESQVHDQAVKAYDAQLDYVEALSKVLALSGEEFHHAEVENAP